MKHTLTYTAELAGVVARLAAELAAGAVTEGTLGEAENVLRALYQSDQVMGGGYTGFIPRDLGWILMTGTPHPGLQDFDQHATTALSMIVNRDEQRWSAMCALTHVVCMLQLLLNRVADCEARGVNA